jgi:N-acetyltransferase 10
MVIAELKAPELGVLLTPFDLKRLESYANNMLDYHVILDLMPTVANLYFQKRLGTSNKGGDTDGQEGPMRLTAVQSSILLAIGLQRKTLEELEVCRLVSFGITLVLISIFSFVKTELNLPVSQALALFGKLIRKISKRLIDIRKAAISAELPEPKFTSASLVGSTRLEGDALIGGDNVAANMEAELEQAGNEVTSAMRERQKEMLASLDLSK